MTDQEHIAALDRIDKLIHNRYVIEYHQLLAKIEAHEASYHRPPPCLPSAMKFRRDQMGETPKQIAKRAGMSQWRWRSLESGCTPTLVDAQKLHSVGIPVSSILLENDHLLPAAHPSSTRP